MDNKSFGSIIGIVVIILWFGAFIYFGFSAEAKHIKQMKSSTVITNGRTK